MDVVKIIKPGQRGNQRFLKRWGERLVAVRIHWQEKELREQVKATGARWNLSLKLWVLRREQLIAMGLTDRIVEGAAERCNDVNTSFQI